ncbi:ROK family protein [Rugosimonospora africana]|uniref:Glucokinase n=1 Tax=Rugosimonospora africana TaxID=556532 RepID=A0A8J3QUZ2_9ACTN|nr:ROK family protein [Rugosimonospora africana]GIH16592.1 glucokinase [Rugosimonospora africana]
MTTVAALDVGGTAMKGAVVREDGTAAYHRWPTPRADGPDAVVAAALKAVDELVARAGSPAAIGVVVPGLVDDDAGVAIYSENIGWHGVAFRDLIRQRTGLPVGFGHDVRAGGLAERALGAAGGVDDVLFMPIGTGISGAMFVSGALVSNRYAGEIGHIDVGTDLDCACGARGCLETIASGAAIARQYHRAGGEQLPGAREVAARRAAGDPIAERVWDEAVNALARALATYVSLLAPERIVIGGGLAGAGEALLGPLRHHLRQLLVWQREPGIVAAALQDNAACLGAALLAREALTTNHSLNQPRQEDGSS